MFSDLQLKKMYWDDPGALSAYKVFAREIHGLDFSEFEARGFWDANYTPFSLFDGERVVANVCIYSLPAIINGEQTRIAQVSAVGALPQWRRQGLTRKLLSIALDWAAEAHDGVFLFSNPDAAPFYEKCNFQAAKEFVETIPAPKTEHCDGAVRLDPGQETDLQKIYDYARNRAPSIGQSSAF